MTQSTRFALGVLISISLSATASFAGNMVVEWDPVADATGYRVYYGTSPGNYNQSRDAGSATSSTLTQLQDCVDYFVAVKAYNAAGESAQFSNEITGWARPEIASSNPGTLEQGEQTTFRILGANFKNGATVEDDNPHVFLDSPTVVSCNEIQLAATVFPQIPTDRPAQIGDFELSVINPDDVFGSDPAGLVVEIDPSRWDVDRRDDASRDRLDGRDVLWVARHFNSQEGDALYETQSDFDGDGWIDGNDVAYVASFVGFCWAGNSWTLVSCPQSLR